MGLTISHATALHATRILRTGRANLGEMDRVNAARPTPWIGKRWTKRAFTPDLWRWQYPEKSRPLDILVRNADERIRMAGITSHVCTTDLPPNSFIWLDEHTVMPCMPLLFTQIAEYASLPALVLLGYELCGHFSRQPDNPARGTIVHGIPAATNVAEIQEFLDSAAEIPGRPRAQAALAYIADHALSAPEAVLATMYALPVQESGFGMGPIRLNQRVELSDTGKSSRMNARYPDLLFPFAPVGINYDGEEHLDLVGLAQTAQDALLAEADAKRQAEQALAAKLDDVRAKAIDDMRRNRELAANGYIVFPASKEDLYEWGALDSLTRQILACARTIFNAQTSQYEAVLDNTELARDRYALLTRLLALENPQADNGEVL